MKIAIVTTVYNDSSIIYRLLQSLLCQSDKRFVHYIYDDGSTDNIEICINNYVKEVNNSYEVVFIRGVKNVGVNKAHEYIFKLVKEKFFTWVDADDWVHKDFVKIIRKYINKKDNIDVFHINSFRYDETTLKRERKATDSWLPRIAKRESDQFPYYCLDGERFFHNFVVKKSTLLEINPTLLIYDCDKEKPFWYDAQILFEIAICHKTFMFVKKPLSNILCRSKSISRAIGISTYNDLKEIGFLLSSMKIKNEYILEFKTLLPFSKERLTLVNMILAGKSKEAKIINKKHKQFIRDNRYPKSYLIFNDYIKYLLFRNRFLFLFKFRRWFIGKIKGC